MFLEKNIDFQRKFWIEIHIKSHILVIMDQKSILCDEPVLSNEDPWKVNENFALLFLNFDRLLIYIDEKQHEITYKSVFSHENWVQNDFCTISGSWDVNTSFFVKQWHEVARGAHLARSINMHTILIVRLTSVRFPLCCACFARRDSAVVTRVVTRVMTRVVTRDLTWDLTRYLIIWHHAHYIAFRRNGICAWRDVK